MASAARLGVSSTAMSVETPTETGAGPQGVGLWRRPVGGSQVGMARGDKNRLEYKYTLLHNVAVT